MCAAGPLGTPTTGPLDAGAGLPADGVGAGLPAEGVGPVLAVPGAAGALDAPPEAPGPGEAGVTPAVSRARGVEDESWAEQAEPAPATTTATTPATIAHLRFRPRPSRAVPAS
ncbi:hypothetical protein [Peterkaempfera sp. SMS 1(5)a]|uniref:hypothetical protein n=1 Tax=Peterkaempfera podocarpi TaxID=3232308 RepID=UPI00366B4E49